MDRGVRIPLIAAVIAFAVYWTNLSAPVSPDASSHVYLAYSWVRDGDADLSEFAAVGPPYTFRAHNVGDRLYASYTPGNALLITPLVLIASALGIAPASSLALGVVAKLMASLLVATSVAAVAGMMLRLVPGPVALFFTFLYAFGTANFSIASQVYLEHAGSIALIAAAFLVVIRRGPSRDGAVAGLLLGVAVVVRPTNLFIALAMLGFFIHRRRPSAFRYALWGTAPAAFLLTFNTIALGSPFASTRFFPEGGDLLQGLIGQLVSPNRGLLVYTPFLTLSLLAFADSWRQQDEPGWLIRYASIAFIASVALVSWYEEWWGGCSFGNRYLADLMPAYALGLAHAQRRGWLRRSWAWRSLAVAAGWSIFVHLMGAGIHYSQWQGLRFDPAPVFAATNCAGGLWAVYQGQLHYVAHVLANEPPPGMALEITGIASAAVIFARLRTGSSRPAPTAPLPAFGTGGGS